MRLDWRRDDDGMQGAYAAWEAAQAEGPDPRWRPCFLELTAPAGGVTEIDALLRMPGLVLPPWELDWLLTLRDRLDADGSEEALQAVGYLRAGGEATHPPTWRLQHVGPPLASTGGVGGGQGAAFGPPDRDRRAEPPILAVIDDSIGYLNRRFRAGERTRIAALWQQATEAGAERVLRRGDIDALIGQGRDEAETYARDAERLSPLPQPQILRRRASHGTMVLDLAAGSAPGEPDAEEVARMPILAVQLPVFAVGDTSGRRLEPFVAQGLRWVVTEALRSLAGVAPRALIVNLSLGSLAGPGDATAFLARIIAQEAERYERHAGAAMRVVAAYGNARRGRLVARALVARGQPLALDWRLQPDDRTASFLELRAEDARGLRLSVRAPGEEGPGLSVPWPRPGERHMAGRIAMVMGEAEARPSVLVALAPTEGPAGAPLAPPGAWRIEVSSQGGSPVLATARVQRDETLRGHWTAGRQSWLDHAAGWDWSKETGDWSDPAPGNPVLPGGTAVAHAGATSPRVWFVGAARPMAGDPDGLEPTPYSAEGATVLPWTGETAGPDLVALAEDGRFLAGRRASGLLSGTVARAGGTSLAAPQAARRLALAFLRRPEGLSENGEIGALLGPGMTKATLPTRHARRGFGPLAPP